MLNSGPWKTTILSFALSTGLLYGQLTVDFEGYEGTGSAGKVATLYAENLPEGVWVIDLLVQGGVIQSLGGTNSNAAIVDNALVLEANGFRYGLNHRYDGFDIYSGVPYTNQLIWGFIEISVWEAHNASATAAAAGSVQLTCVTPVLEIQASGHALELSWPADAARLQLQYTESLYLPWKPVSEQPSVIGDRCVCMGECDRQACYYRLILP